MPWLFLAPCTQAADAERADGGVRQQHRVHQGRPVQVDPIKPTLKAPGTKRLKLEFDELLSDSGFEFKLRRYTKVAGQSVDPLIFSTSRFALVRRCRLSVSNPVFKLVRAYDFSA
jgi:hypothetical protein